MKYHILLLLVILASCAPSQIQTKTTTETFIVAPNKVPCDDKLCLFVNNEIFEDNIQDFTHKEGVAYELLVEVSTQVKKDNIIDEEYRLIRIVSIEATGKKS